VPFDCGAAAAALIYRFFSEKAGGHRFRMEIGEERPSKRVIEAFVIAFIHCNGQSCVISHPRPGRVYSSYIECKSQLPRAPAGKGFDAKTFEGSEIACIEVLAHATADEWVA
jgi:hypothetical protein